MTTTRDIALNVIADVRRYQEGFAKLPGFTDKSAAAAARALEKRLSKAQANAVRAAQKAAAGQVTAQKKAAKEAAAAQRKAAELSTKAWQSAGSAIAGAISVAAVKGALSSLGGLAQEVADLRNELGDLSAEGGLTPKTLVAIDFAAKTSGRSLSEFDSILKQLPKRMLDVQRGTGESLVAFEKLGIEVDDGTGKLRSSDDVLRELISKLQKVEDPTLRAALATQALGEKGATLMQVLGGRELEDLTDFTEKFGTDVGPEAIAKAQKWQQVMAEFGLVWGDFKARAIDALDPAEHLDSFTTAMKFFGEFTMRTIEQAAAVLGGFGAQAAALIAGDFQRAAQASTKTGKIWRNAWFSAAEGAAKATEEFIQARDAARGVGVEHEKNVNPAIGKTTEELKKEEAAAKKAAAAAAKAAREQEAAENAAAKAAQDRQKAWDDFSKIWADAHSDMLSAEDKLLAKQSEQVTQILKIGRERQRLAEDDAERADIARQQQEAIWAITERTERDIQRLQGERHQAWLDALQDAKERTEANRQEQLEGEREHQAELGKIRAAALDVFGTVYNGIFALEQQRHDQVMQGLREEHAEQTNNIEDLKRQIEEKKQAAIDAKTKEERAKLKLEVKTLKASLKAEQGRRDQTERALVKEFNAQKKLKIGQTWANAAEAILKGFAQQGPPPSPAGVAAKIATVAEAGVQTALIANQKPPTFHTGDFIDRVFGLGPDEVTITARQGEFVGNQRAAETLGRDGVDAVNSGVPPMPGPVQVLLDGRVWQRMTARALESGGRASRAFRPTLPGMRQVYVGG